MPTLGRALMGAGTSRGSPSRQDLPALVGTLHPKGLSDKGSNPSDCISGGTYPGPPTLAEWPVPQRTKNQCVPLNRQTTRERTP